MVSRRDVLKGLAAVAVAVPVAHQALGVLGVTGQRTSRATQKLAPAEACIPPDPTGVVAAPAPWDLISPLRAGSDLGGGWSVESLSPVMSGATVLVLAKGPRRERVHICRNDGSPRGEAHTRTLDVVLMNGGKGSTQTEESIGCAVIAVARILQENENSGAGGDALAFLESHDARLERYGKRGCLT
jgi:hypothetical protein